MDELVYMNSPVDYMKNFPEDHPYMQLFRSQKAVICCGQGDWEQPDTTWFLKRIFEAKNIPIWVDLWGHDVNHDWNWWYKQTAYYMPYILGSSKQTLSALTRQLSEGRALMHLTVCSNSSPFEDSPSGESCAGTARVSRDGRSFYRGKRNRKNHAEFHFYFAQLPHQLLAVLP